VTLPSAFLDKVAELLGDELPGTSVEVIDRMFGARDRDYVNVSFPGVLVTCARLRFDGQYTPPVATGEFVAVCLARFDEPTEGPVPLSGGDVAMNLAALVAAHVEGQRWDDLGFSAPRRVRVESMQSLQLAEKEINGWAVRWEQDFEVTFAGPDREQFRTLGITVAVGDANTPDVEAVHQRPEEPPP